MTRELIHYPAVRAIEDVAFRIGWTPVRVFRLLLPVWQVEVSATITDGRPYELIDRFLELGIHKAGLGTVDELADFLCLDRSLVDRALRVLGAIGHLDEQNGRLVLTGIGLRSVREGTCYVLTREDRRRLYFDAFSSRPLTRAYYESRTVTMLTTAEWREHAATRWPYHVLDTDTGLDSGALAALAALPDRERFNLPERIDEPRQLGSSLKVRLPVYLVRAVDPDGAVRSVVYTQATDPARDGNDPELTELCEHTPEIAAALRAETVGPGLLQHVRDWLDKRGVGPLTVDDRGDGLIRATVRPSAFGEKGLGITTLGSYVPVRDGLLNVWCDDLPTRRRALLRRLDSIVQANTRFTRRGADETITRIAAQLALGPLDTDAARRLAAEAQMSALARRLDRLE
ncbi:hypothetical protein [Allonocardiopsis opalescens]|uniref:Uncharacterized protein n=1 Tax=Allonocardiopsis opalescens TaxID=1144618 RepID=A0A2T0Q2L0_9ACTN|nr:hypothetical protein [Allonocardiopsis opalescens]PRX98025.1 hypothetical protein CLV72_105378 [Allonocardiopsis opalescens]